MLRLGEHDGFVKTSCGGICSIWLISMYIAYFGFEFNRVFQNTEPIINQVTEKRLDENTANITFADVNYLPYVEILPMHVGDVLDKDAFWRHLHPALWVKNPKTGQEIEYPLVECKSMSNMTIGVVITGFVSNYDGLNLCPDQATFNKVLIDEEPELRIYRCSKRQRADCLGEDDEATRRYLDTIRLSIDRVESLVNYKVLNSSQDLLPIDLTNVFVGQIDMVLDKTQRLYEYLQLNNLVAEVYGEDARIVQDKRSAKFM